MGSRWISPSGGLWLSIILRPAENLGKPGLIPAIAALAVREALLKFGVDGEIKWPNDVTVNRRKIAGILCESLIQGQRTRWIVVGIGVNVNNAPPSLQQHRSDYKAESMIRLIRKNTSLASLAQTLQKSLLKAFNALAGGSEREILDEYNAHNALTGRKVRLYLRDGVIEGIARGIDDNGRLSLMNDDDRLRKVSTEDVLRIAMSCDEPALRNSL